MLTTATVELASGEMVAGASRLVFGGMQLLLLAFGIVAGAELAGLPSESVLHDDRAQTLGMWAPWLGQLAGNLVIGADVSGFFGALVMAPVALAVARFPGGSPAQVTFLPAFWLLVPGAIGLIGVTEIVANPAAASIQDLVSPLASIVSIALGVLCGVTLYRAVATGAAVGTHHLRARGRTIVGTRRR